MSQLSELFDKPTEELLDEDEDVKSLMALMDEQPLPNLSADQNYPAHHQQRYSLNYPQLPLMVEMPLVEHLPTSVSNNNIELVNKEEFQGGYGFEVIIDPHHAGSKSPWVYSQSLKKMFIQINNWFPVDIKITPKPGERMPELFLRVTPCYGNSQDSMTLVKRCLQHMQANQNHDVHEDIWEHIIRCKNNNASYYGGKLTQKHLSVLVPLGQPTNGLDCVRNMYQFVCKNSCTSGMNRRALDVVFTLEDKCANVLGRVLMSARICSCPKRDKEKEEKEHFNRDNNSQPPTKKRKAEKRPLSMSQSTSNLAEYELAIKIPGKHNLLAVYKYLHDLMAGEMLRHGTEGPFRKTMNEINKLTKNFE